jgi:hypothetical protein
MLSCVGSCLVKRMIIRPKSPTNVCKINNFIMNSDWEQARERNPFWKKKRRRGRGGGGEEEDEEEETSVIFACVQKTTVDW